MILWEIDWRDPLAAFAPLEAVLEIGALVLDRNRSPAGGVAIKGAINRRRVDEGGMLHHHPLAEDFIAHLDELHVGIDIEEVGAGGQPGGMAVEMAITLQ